METFVLERSWKELTLMGGQYLVYRVDDGHGSSLLFFDIRNTEVVPYDYVWGGVAGNANIAFQPLTVVVGGAFTQQILIISRPGDKSQDTKGFMEVLQVFHGFNQPLDRVRMQLPTPREHGKLPNQAITGPTLGATWGWWFEGHESPYDNPTGRGMFIMLDRMDLQIGVEHRTDRIVTPSSNFLLNRMEVFPLDPSDSDDRKVIADILRGKTRSKYWSPAMRDVPYPKEAMKSAYNVEGVYWDGKEAITPNGVKVI